MRKYRICTVGGHVITTIIAASKRRAAQEFARLSVLLATTIPGWYVSA